MHALIENQTVKRYPYTVTQLRMDNPGSSFSDNPNPTTLAKYNVYEVARTTTPEYNPNTHKLVEGTPEFFDGKWLQVWKVELLKPSELAARADALKRSISDEVQARLDYFARTRNYDNMFSACTYATSKNPRFSAEGQRCVDLRDATWDKMYEILAEVEAGTRPIPNGYEDIEGELPELTW